MNLKTKAMKTPLSPRLIPVVHVTDFQTKVNPIEVGLSVLVDGRKAFIYEHMLNDGFYQREKIVIQFSEKHPKFADGLFQTKYYEINEPGKLAWGHEGEVMKVEYLHVA